jgi:hypothetical protein
MLHAYRKTITSIFNRIWIIPQIIPLQNYKPTVGCAVFSSRWAGMHFMGE